MIAALATAAFLTAAWVAIVSIAGSIEGSMAKIEAAFRGQPPLLTAAPALRVSQRYPQARPQRVQARPAMRAAA